MVKNESKGKIVQHPVQSLDSAIFWVRRNGPCYKVDHPEIE